MKTCTVCGTTKPLTDFVADRRRKDGKSSRCKPCVAEEARRRRRENPDYLRNYYRRNRERILAEQKAWREANPELARERSNQNAARNSKNWAKYQRAYREKHREKRSAQTKAWCKANNDKVRAYRRKSENKRRARKAGLPCEDIVPEQVFERDAGACGICGHAVQPDDWHLDHIIPLAAGGSHTYENVQVAHPLCNLRKGPRLAAA